MIQRLIIFLALSLPAWAAETTPTSDRFGIYGAGTYSGVVGGIPARTGGNVIAVTSHGWSGANTAAQNKTAFDAAAAASSDGDIILLPSNISHDFNGIYGAQNLRNRTIRGGGSTGANRTRLIIPIGVQAIVLGSSQTLGEPSNRSNQVTAVARGSNTITLATSDTLYNGYRQMFRISFLNEAVTPGVFTNTRNTRVRCIDVIGTGQAGTTLTLSQPMPYDYTAALAEGNATIEELFQVNYLTYGVGIEGIFFDCLAHASGNPTYSGQLSYLEGCWLKDVKIETNANFALAISDGVNLELKKSEFIGSSAGGPGKGGVIIDHLTNSLFWDTYFEGAPSLYHWGNNVNNVFAYSDFEGIVNVNHNAWSSHNLYEGNSIPRIQSDGFYGPSSADTFHRNWFRDGSLGSLKRFTRDYNYDGNLVGTNGEEYDTDGSDHDGDPNIGNQNSEGTPYSFINGPLPPDWDASNGRNKQVPMELTARDTEYTGTVTILDSGDADDFEARLDMTDNSYPRMRNGFSNQFLYFGTRSGSTWPVSSNAPNATGTILPPLNTTDNVITGPGGYQQVDLDVALTKITKANRYVFHDGVPMGEQLSGGDTLPVSRFLSSKPDWMGTKSYPTFDYAGDGSAARTDLPVGHRKTNGNENYLTPVATYRPGKLRFMRR